MLRLIDLSTQVGGSAELDLTRFSGGWVPPLRMRKFYLNLSAGLEVDEDDRCDRVYVRRKESERALWGTK